jgi:hypothetical protein
MCRETCAAGTFSLGGAAPRDRSTLKHLTLAPLSLSEPVKLAARAARGSGASPEREIRAAFPSPNKEPIPRSDRGVPAARRTADFLPIGGAIRRVLKNKRVRCNINQTAARCAGLRIISRPLKIARYAGRGGGGH